MVGTLWSNKDKSTLESLRHYKTIKLWGLSRTKEDYAKNANKINDLIYEIKCINIELKSRDNM